METRRSLGQAGRYALFISMVEYICVVVPLKNVIDFRKATQETAIKNRKKTKKKT